MFVLRDLQWRWLYAKRVLRRYMRVELSTNHGMLDVYLPLD